MFPLNIIAWEHNDHIVMERNNIEREGKLLLSLPIIIAPERNDILFPHNNVVRERNNNAWEGNNFLVF